MISAVITGAGNSTRFGSNKLLELIGGKPLIIRTIEQMLLSELVDEVIVTSRKEDLPTYQQLIEEHLFMVTIPIQVVVGGAERVISLKNGVEKATGNWIVTHDGARPLAPSTLIEELLTAAKETGAAMTAINPVATVKITEGDSMIISGSLMRKQTWIAQTPQLFKKAILEEALQKAIEQQYFVPTDDSEIISLMTGTAVKVVPGDPINIKVTFPEDVTIANELFAAKEEKTVNPSYA